MGQELRNCIACQGSKTGRHTESGVGTFPQPRRRFSHMHVDIVGRFPSSDGGRYLLTVTERSTRWPEATPMSEVTADARAKALLSSWISRFGVPDDITTDRGTTFTLALWTALARLMGTKHHTTTAYNPTANGMVERTYRFLKASLMACCMVPDWKERHHLPAPNETLLRTASSHPPAFVLDKDIPTKSSCRTPPQIKTPPEPASGPRRRRGRPRTAVEPPRSTVMGGILLSDSPEDEEPEHVPRQMASCMLGLLQPQARYH
ncbi:uncharacterized protein LOC135207380 [Macrobrachium nipponense]|uniref:uncharacterized protein LOC135207380 n=1 Tax=Macrobrachium nipponense TaxID=159736 RepID=UPI0030C89A42